MISIVFEMTNHVFKREKSCRTGQFSLSVKYVSCSNSEMPYNGTMLFFKNKKYVLMHKNVEVLEGPYSLSTHTFAKEPKVLNAKHLPIGTLKEGKLSLNRLNYWWVWRGIPDYRVALDTLLDHLGVKSAQELIDLEYGLSVSDHYWLRPANEKLSYDDLSFFHRSFDQDGFGRAMFSDNRYQAPESALYTPNNTLAGYQRKAWFSRRDGLVLLKGGTPFYQQEPINEWLASKMAQRLGIDCVSYIVEVYENKLVSVCPNMLNDRTELVPASEILRSLDPDKDEFWFNPYLNYLIDHGVPHAEKKLEDMLVLDYLMLNTDRHAQNLGVLLNADTMEYTGMAPVFDTGTGLGCLLKDKDIDTCEELENCQLFNARKMSHEKLIDMVTDLSRYDFTQLNGMDTEYERMLRKYQRVTSMTDRRIESVIKLLQRRIERIKQHASNH